MHENRWYYHEAGQQKGAVSEATLKELLTRGTIPTDTLVWREGMTDWQRASEAFAVHSTPSTPSPPTTSRSTTSTTHTIKKMPVILTIIFTIITMGIYYPCWFLTRRKALNSLSTSDKLGTGVFVFAIVILSISVLLNFTIGALAGVAEGLGDMDFILIATVADRMISIVAGITLLVQCFKVRSILREHLWRKHFSDHLGQSVDLSGVALFFFQIHYLQYKINRL